MATTTLNYQGQRVTVMGLGSFGGGVGAVRFLVEHGARVVVTDLRTENELADSLNQLDADWPIELRLGKHVESDFRNSDLIVVNPAVPTDSHFLKVARSAGVPLTSEMNLFWQHNRGRVIGVTGSNGKSTTTALIHSALEAAGVRCWLGGNIGNSLLPRIDDILPADWVVLELSSFQLDDLDRLQASPDIAVVTNFSPNHLDRHGSLDAYRRAKQTIVRWQTSEQIAVLNHNDADVALWPTTARRLTFGKHDRGNYGSYLRASETIFRLDGRETAIPILEHLRLPGSHNLRNAQAAACAALAAGIPASAVCEGFGNFRGLPHRLQFVAEVDGRKFYNDSLATTPESVAAALDAFDEPVVLLAGGYDKQVALDDFAAAIANKTKAVALMGQTAASLAAGLTEFGNPSAKPLLPHAVCTSFGQAFDWAIGHSTPGDVVLLSPGCASYDWFRNFAERGARFTELVNALDERHGTTESRKSA